MRAEASVEVNVTLSEDDLKALARSVTAADIATHVDKVYCDHLNPTTALHALVDLAAQHYASCRNFNWDEFMEIVTKFADVDVRFYADDADEILIRHLYPDLLPPPTALDEAKRMAKAMPPKRQLPWDLASQA